MRLNWIMTTSQRATIQPSTHLQLPARRRKTAGKKRAVMMRLRPNAIGDIVLRSVAMRRFYIGAGERQRSRRSDCNDHTKREIFAVETPVQSAAASTIRPTGAGCGK